MPDRDAQMVMGVLMASGNTSGAGLLAAARAYKALSSSREREERDAADELLLRDVRDGHVRRVYDPRRRAVNERTGEECTAAVDRLADGGAIREATREPGSDWRVRVMELTLVGRMRLDPDQRS